MGLSCYQIGIKMLNHDELEKVPNDGVADYYTEVNCDQLFSVSMMSEDSNYSSSDSSDDDYACTGVAQLHHAPGHPKRPRTDVDKKEFLLLQKAMAIAELEELRKKRPHFLTSEERTDIAIVAAQMRLHRIETSLKHPERKLKWKQQGKEVAKLLCRSVKTVYGVLNDFKKSGLIQEARPGNFNVRPSGVCSGFKHGTNTPGKPFYETERIQALRGDYLAALAENRRTQTFREIYLDESYVHAHHKCQSQAAYHPDDEYTNRRPVYRGARYCFVAAIMGPRAADINCSKEVHAALPLSAKAAE